MDAFWMCQAIKTLFYDIPYSYNAARGSMVFITLQDKKYIEVNLIDFGVREEMVFPVLFLIGFNNI